MVSMTRHVMHLSSWTDKCTQMQQKEEEGGEYENIAVELVLEDYQSINQTLTVYEKNLLFCNGYEEWRESFQQLRMKL